jgi:release factor glutamine methyltransferase
MSVLERGTGTIREAFVEASSFFKERGIADSASCAELLLQHVLGWSRSRLLLHWEEQLPSELAPLWREYVARKAEGEPVQYITGEQEFYGLQLEVVSGAVLIPRPETELLVEGILREEARLFGQGAAVRLADIGTGSGAIPVALACARPAWRMIACDISPQALDVARRNAAKHGVAGQIAFYEGDLLGPLLGSGITVDVLVSNPPYIPAADIPLLQPEVRLYEPHLALVGGDDGLAVYRRLTQQLPELPTLVALEVGIGQSADVSGMLGRCADWDEIYTIPDLAGIERHVMAVRRHKNFS